MKKLTLTIALLSVAAVSAYLPQDEAKLGQMKQQLSHTEGRVPVMHSEIAKTREAIARTAAEHDVMQKDTGSVPSQEAAKATELQSTLKSCETERDRLLNECARLREEIAREEAAADVREKDTAGAVAAAA